MRVLSARRLGCDPAQATLDVKLMGIKVFPKFRGTHVFVHACYLLLQYAFETLKVVRVGWRTPPENIRSQKAAEKLGLAREGVMRCVYPRSYTDSELRHRLDVTKCRQLCLVQYIQTCTLCWMEVSGLPRMELSFR